jgi:two-component system, chemotaxis family, chemotaxis protein CheY
MRPDSILIADDNADCRGLAVAALEQEGFTVREACDGEEALATLRESGSPHCLMLMDLMMPRMTGWDLVAAVRSDPLLRDNPIIVTTAVPEDAPSGIDAVLEKPFDIDALVRIVERHCSRFAPPARVPPAASDFEVTPYY